MNFFFGFTSAGGTLCVSIEAPTLDKTMLALLFPKPYYILVVSETEQKLVPMGKEIDLLDYDMCLARVDDIDITEAAVEQWRFLKKGP